MNHEECGPDCTPGLHCPACHGMNAPHRGQHALAGAFALAVEARNEKENPVDSYRVVETRDVVTGETGYHVAEEKWLSSDRFQLIFDSSEARLAPPPRVMSRLMSHAEALAFAEGIAFANELRAEGVQFPRPGQPVS